MIEELQVGLTEDEIDKVVEGRDINVCIRARPLLAHEVEQNHFDVVHATPQTFHFLESKLNVRQQPIIEKQEFQVDHAFGPRDDNDKVYQ